MVGGESRAWREGEAVAFDDTYEHEAWNRGSRTRVVLIIDVWNPHLTAAERDAVAALAEVMGRLQRGSRHMSARIIDGKRIAEEFRREVRIGTDALEQQGRRRPGLAVVMVGDNAASAVYVRNKRRACEETGIVSVAHDLPASTTRGRTPRADRPAERRSRDRRHPRPAAPAAAHRLDGRARAHRPVQGRRRVPSVQRRPARAAHAGACGRARPTG